MTNRIKSLRYLLRRKFFKIFGSLEYDRLYNSLLSFRLELDNKTDLDTSLKKQITDILSKADNEVNLLNYDAGWRHLNIARRKLIKSYQGDELKNAILAFQEESKEKLSGWRKQTVDEVLKPESDAKELEYCIKILDDHFNNRAIKSRLKSRQVTFILFVLALQLISIFIFKNQIFLLDSCGRTIPLPDNFTFAMVPSAILFGSLGSTFNGIISVAKAQMRIPDQKANYRYKIIRIILGAITGLIIYFFICASILDVLNVEANNFERILVYAFIAGFSEDYLVALIGEAENNSQKQ